MAAIEPEITCHKDENLEAGITELLNEDMDEWKMPASAGGICGPIFAKTIFTRAQGQGSPASPASPKPPENPVFWHG